VKRVQEPFETAGIDASGVTVGYTHDLSSATMRQRFPSTTVLPRTDSLGAVVQVATVAAGTSLLVWAFRSDGAWFDRHVLANYCPIASFTLAFETLARWAVGGLGIAVALVVRPRLARFASRASSAAWRMAASIALAALLALVLCDLYLRHREGARSLEREPGLPPMRVDETGNFVPIPSSAREWDVEGRLVRYETDAAGNRTASAVPAVDMRAPTVLFTGESIALGWGVPYERAFPFLVGRALGLQAVDVAVTGFAFDQAYLRAKEMLSRFEAPVALVTIVVPAELERTVDPKRQRLALGDDGRLEIVPRSRSPLATSPLRKLLPFHTDEAIPLARAIFRATDELARSRGARALFVFTNFGPPCVPESDGVSRLERDLFFGLDVAHTRVEVPPASMIRPPREVHPSEKGHEALAAAVVEALRTFGAGKP
jgi:hypothetical protein